MLQVDLHQIGVEGIEEGVNLLIQIVSIHHVLEPPDGLLYFLSFFLEFFVAAGHDAGGAGDGLLGIPGELFSELQAFEGDVGFVLLGVHGQFLAEGEDEQGGEDDARYGRDEAHEPTDVGGGDDLAVANCAHGDDDQPEGVLEDLEIVVVLLGQHHHPGYDVGEGEGEDDQAEDRRCVEDGFDAEVCLVFGVVDSAHAVGPGGAVN